MGSLSAATRIRVDDPYLPWPEPIRFEPFTARRWRAQIFNRHAAAEGIHA